MVQRLRQRDLAFLVEETPAAPRHNATVEVFDPEDSGFDYDRLVALISDRIAFVPRYRQRLQQVPGRVANPVWVDDEAFDLGQVLLDRDDEPKVAGGQDWGDDWSAHRPPSSAGLLAAALKETVTDPHTAVDTLRGTFDATLRNAEGVASRVARVGNALTGRRPERDTPLSGKLSQQRRVVTVTTDLKDYRRIREGHGGTVNDAVLATVTGGLRAWLMTRAESMGGLRKVHAVVPMSVIDRELEATSLGTQVAPHFVDLPVGEASPVVRLHQVSYSFQSHKETGRAVAANRLAGIAGFAPATFHAIGSRVAAFELRRGFQIAITNVPGPQSPLYAAGARMVGTYPVPPLLPGQALAIGITSYDGKVFFGITADRDLVPDADTFGQCIREALDELLDTVSGGRSRAPRGRRKTASAKKKATKG